MASIYLNRGYIYLSYYIGGKRYVKSLGMKYTEQNWKKAEIIRLQHELNYKVLNPTISVASLQYLQYKSQLVKPKSLKDYKIAINHFISIIGNITLNSLTEEHIAQYINAAQINLKPNTVMSYLNKVKIFLKYCHKQKYIDKLPEIKITYKKKVINIIPEDELNKFLEYLKQRNIKHYRFVYFLAHTGFRVNEAIQLRWENIDFNNNMIKLVDTKSKEEAFFPLTNTMKNFLLEFRKSSGKVFEFNSINSLYWFRKVFHKFFNHRYTLHDIRRTFCTNLLRKNVNPYKVMKLLRHKDFRTTIKHYANVELQSIADELEKLKI